MINYLPKNNVCEKLVENETWFVYSRIIATYNDNFTINFDYATQSNASLRHT